MKTVVCKNCGEEKEHLAKGMCKKCYSNKRYHNENPLACYKNNWAFHYDKCVDCGTTKNKHKGHGLCSKCYYKKIFYPKHKKRKIAYQKEYRGKYPEKIKSRKKRWKEKNPNYSKDYMKKYYKDRIKPDKDKIRERKVYAERYRKAHKEEIRLLNQTFEYRLKIRKSKSKKRLKERGVFSPNGISISTQKQIFKRDKVCVYCSGNKKLEIDHIVSIAKGGNNDYNNLVLSCKSCNNQKRDADVFEWCKKKGIEVPKIVVKLLNKQKEQSQLNKVMG